MPARCLRSSSIIIGALLAAIPAPGAVISEIHYHPPAGDEALEFVELQNDTANPEDLSGWSFVEGISFEFPPGTILPPRGQLVLCLDPQAVMDRYGIENVLGAFTGRLDASGERLTLANHSRVVVQSVRYRDDGKWPTGPDGTGHTLVLRQAHLDATEPESWTQSPELGGSPGRANFPDGEVQFVDRVIVQRGASWRYRKGQAAFSAPPTAWRDPAFVDSGWDEGPSGFGYGDGDDATELEDMLGTYTSVACRIRFELSAEDLLDEAQILLAIDYDDGFCSWINGAEGPRVNCGNPGQELAFDAPATGAREAGSEDLLPLPRASLRAGQNVLCVAGYNFSSTSSDFSLIPRVILRRPIDPGAGPGGLPAVVFNELLRSPVGAGWVELRNNGAAVDLAGYRVTDDPERAEAVVLAAGSSVIPAGGFLRVNESAGRLVLSTPRTRVFLLAPDGRAAAASVFDREAPPGVAAGAWSEGRWPDGGPLSWVTATPTPAAPNQVARVESVVINEVFYHPPEFPIAGFSEFIELHNTSTNALDVSGFRFDRGIEYVIPEGISIPGGGFLVVAEDPAVMAREYGLSGVLGPYVGRLANDGESVRILDRLANPVDDVRYHEGGEWSQWADGGGASLELIDPRADNTLASAWDASDESEKAAWEKLSYTVPAYAPAAESELHLFLAERGICRIDDVSLTRSGGANHIPNPGFETSTSPWIIQGTHLASRRITGDAHTGSASLEINATGKGDSLVNRLEIDTSPRLTAGPYEVSLWARWQRGTSLIIGHGEFAAGPYGSRPSPATNLSGNTLGGRFRMTIPFDLGTPGAENSVRRNLRQSSGSGNLGPTIAEVVHRPGSPAAAQPVTVTALIRDPDGVAEARVHYRDGSAAGAFASVALLDDGLHGDGAAGDGIHGGEIPGGAAASRTVFYVEARDGPGASRRSPVDAPARTHLYQAQGPLNEQLDSYRFILDTARTAEFQSRPLHSNDLLDGTFVFGNDQVYYHVGVRYRGSPWGRPGVNSFRVRFPDDRTFHRGRKSVNLSSRGGAPNEGSGYFLVGRNGAPEKPAPTSDYVWIRTWYNGNSYGTQAMIQPADLDYLTHWYGEEGEALLLKANGRIMFTDGGTLAAWDGASYVHMGTNIENYRGYFTHSVRQSLDRWEPLIALTRIMDARTTPAATFDREIDGILDVEAWLRVIAPRILMADWDAFSIGNGHNGYLALDPRDGRWEILPFDMDNSFGNASPNLFPASDPDVARLLSRPGPRRTYFRVIHEYVNGYWASARAGPYLDAVQAATGIGTGGIKGFLDASGNAARAQIQSSVNAAFRIITNAGNDISTPLSRLDIEGEAPVHAATIAVSRDGGELEVLQPAWSTPIRWKVGFDLNPGTNQMDFHAFDGEGTLLASTDLVVHSGSDGTITITSWTPQTGTSLGGTLVTFQGTGFRAGLRVLFGGVESAAVTVVSGELARAVAPPAPAALPGDGRVDIELLLPPGRLVLARGFTYIAEPRFLRGDANSNGQVELGDAIAILFYLFNGVRLTCLDAADVHDNGRIGVNDATGVVDYLFRSGPAPASPWPAPGPDPTDDSFRCP